MLRELPMKLVKRNPDQPRKHFDEGKLRELGESILAHGLIQPISVRPVGDEYVIVAGERRYRAHILIAAETILALTSETEEQDADEQSIVENLQRVDISPLEEANAYKRMLDRYGYDAGQLAKRLGIKQVWRISDRMSLLNLNKEYRNLLSNKQITPSQGYEMSRLEPHNQDVLFRAIRSGKVDDYHALRSSSTALFEQEKQTPMFVSEEPTEKERTSNRGFEAKVERVAELLRAGIVDGEVVAAVQGQAGECWQNSGPAEIDASRPAPDRVGVAEG